MQSDDDLSRYDPDMGIFSKQVAREKQHGTLEHIKWILYSDECSNLIGEQKKILIKGVWGYPKQIQKFPINRKYSWTPNGLKPKLKK